MKAIWAAVVAVLILGAVVVSLEMSGGPLQDTSGVVQGVKDVHNATTGATDRVATVVLSNGKVVQAKIPRNEDMRSGQAVHLRVSKNLSSGGSLFEVATDQEPAK
jgi:hypothetical protein